MSAVTASIIVGSRHRTDPGIQPRWIVLLHEGTSYAWHLVRLHLSVTDAGTGLDDPPGILWRASAAGDHVGDLALLLHVHAARTPAVVQAVHACESLRRQRVDLADLSGRELADVENATRLARASGRELLLAATIYPGSRLTESDLCGMPDWELNVSSTAVSREWKALDGGRLVVTDYREAPTRGDVDDGYDDGVEDGIEDDGEWAGAEPGAEEPVLARTGGGRGSMWRQRTSERKGDPAGEDNDGARSGTRPLRIDKVDRPRISLADFFGRGGH